MSPQLETMTGKGSKVDYFWTIDLQVLVPRQFAHVCRSVNMEWGCDCPSQMQKIRF
jgi:hypothetical protein